MADYCTIADVQNRLSADGVTYRTDDTPPTTYGDVLDEASREIDFYCLARYDEALLASSNWVKHQCAVIAAFLLCERRGNPVPRGIAGKYERTIEKLEKVQLGTVAVPGIVERRTAVPTMSNVRIRLDDPAQVADLASGISASVTVQTGDAAPPLSAQAGN